MIFKMLVGLIKSKASMADIRSFRPIRRSPSNFRLWVSAGAGENCLTQLFDTFRVYFLFLSLCLQCLCGKNLSYDSKRDSKKNARTW